MPKPKGLTLKQRKFRKELFKTGKPTESAMRAYDCKDRRSAGQIAYENLKKLDISMIELMERMGLTAERDAEDLKKLRKAQKVIGYLHQYKKNKDGQVEKANPDEAVSNEFVEVDDNQTQLKALELTFKLKKLLDNRPLIDQSQHLHISYGYRTKPDNSALRVERGRSLHSQPNSTEGS